MRSRAPHYWRCVALAVGLAVGAFAWAEPDGWAINSRDYLSEDHRIGALWQVDLESGSAELGERSRIANFIFIEGIAFDGDGLLYGVDDDTNTLVRIGTQSGNAVAVDQTIGNLGLSQGNHDFGLTFTCDGRLLMSTDSESLGVSLYEADPQTGEAQRIGDLGAPIVDLTSLGDTVYGIGRGLASDAYPASPYLYRIDIETGSAEPVGPLGAEAGLYNKAGLAADADGQLWAVTERRESSDDSRSLPSQVLRIDPATGQAEAVSRTRAEDTGADLIGIESLAIAGPGECSRGTPIAASPIPSLSRPGQWLLGLLFLALAALSLRRLGTT